MKLYETKKLYETITAENWFKGPPNHPDRGDRRCLRMHFSYTFATLGFTRMVRAEYALHEAIRLLYPERGLCPDDRRIYMHLFNDHSDTTLEDILRVCKVADV